MGDGKVALVTGAGSGMGRAAALAFADAGHAVAVVDIVGQSAEETAHAIEARGGRAIAISANVAVEDEVSAAVSKTVSAFGRLDCAFNNAGVQLREPMFTECDQSLWDKTIAVNLTGVWLCLKHESRQMLAQESGGAIVNTASVLGQVGMVNNTAYCASKAGIIGMTRAAALDCATKGIRINAICPGIISNTGMTGSLDDKPTGLSRRSLIPTGEFGTAADIANMAVWLCSDKAGYVTGQAISVDGGYTAW